MKTTFTIPMAFLSAIIIAGCGGSSNSEIIGSPISNQNPPLVTGQPKLEFAGPIYKTEDSFGNLKLLGEITNSGNTTASFAELKCAFYDSSSNLIGEDSSYVVGTVVRLVQSDMLTNTALKPSDKGAYEVWTNLKSSGVARYSCTPTFSIYATADPAAKLEITGKISAQSDYFNHLELLGEVKNTGTKGLTFGQVYFIVKNKSGSIVDIDFSYITGETVTVSSGITTDTALSINGTGTFSVSTSVPLSSYSSYEPKYDWTDANIQGGVARILAVPSSITWPVIFDKYQRYTYRNQTIQKLHEIASQ